MAVIVLGKNNPVFDIPNVQNAVSTPGTPPDVILQGHFSFAAPPTIPTALAGYPDAMVLVSKAVTISSAPGGATIEGGTIPFYVDAEKLSVTIQNLRFIKPTAKAIVVYAVNGLNIANCKIEGVVPYSQTSSAIDIDTIGAVPKPPPPPGQAGYPEKIFGRVVVAHNEIDVSGGTPKDNTLGIVVFSVGLAPNNEAEIYIVGNRITNVTEPAINIRHIGGQAVVEGNEIHTGSVSGIAPEPEVIRAANDGSFVIAHNTIHCEWPDPQAIGIGVFSQIPPTADPLWTAKNAVVVCNSVTMSPPPGVAFAGLSSGIDIRGFASDNLVAHNKIRGSARAALAVDPFNGGEPNNSTLIHNDVTGFSASMKDIVLGAGVTNTLLIDQDGTIQNDGVNTISVP
jgi:hypothetical protein